jgi:TatD DNase family protein
MLIDTHSHVNFKEFKDDYLEVINRARQKEVAMINVGSQISTSRRAADLAKNFPKTFAAVGLHPIHLQDMEVIEEGIKFKTRAEKFNQAAYEDLAVLKQVVAIGECGLDYYYADLSDKKIKNYQKEVLRAQIQLANENNLPMILHCRGSRNNNDDAYLDMLNELKENPLKCRGVKHCFTASVEVAKKFLDLGFYLGFNGLITFDKTGRSNELVLNTPLDRILLETDCPYLTPDPFRGRRNEPAFVEFVAQKIAQIKRVDYAQIVQKTTQNAKKLFNLSI